MEEVGNRIYKVTFTPQSRGKHRVYVYLNGMEVKGSPFSLRIGKDVREKRALATDIYRQGTRRRGCGDSEAGFAKVRYVEPRSSPSEGSSVTSVITHHKPT